MNLFFSETFRYTSEDLEEKLNFLDLIVGVNQKSKIKEIIKHISEGGKFIGSEHLIAKKKW